MDENLEKGVIDHRYMYPDRVGFIISDATASEQVLDRILNYPLHPFFDWTIRNAYQRRDSRKRYVAGISPEKSPVYVEAKLECFPSILPATEEWSSYEWIWVVTDKTEGMYSISGVSIFELRGEEVIYSSTYFERTYSTTGD